MTLHFSMKVFQYTLKFLQFKIVAITENRENIGIYNKQSEIVAFI